jgi:hypothetical protein
MERPRTSPISGRPAVARSLRQMCGSHDVSVRRSERSRHRVGAFAADWRYEWSRHRPGRARVES